MKMPEFTAEASLYRTNGRYRTSTSSSLGDLQHSHFVTPAYHPTSHARCDDCLAKCIESFGLCLVGAVFWPPASSACVTESWACAAICSLGPWCCPKRCKFDLGDLAGGGCCDADEQCVDPSDPNSRSGCCPSDQSVCGGRCCAKGATCCGNECCPAGWFCIDGFCSEFPGPLLPPKGTPPEPSPHKWSQCIAGYTPCNGNCCPPGKECCGDGVCRWTCLH
jgi:hypothetical protein